MNKWKYVASGLSSGNANEDGWLHLLLTVAGNFDADSSSGNLYTAVVDELRQIAGDTPVVRRIEQRLQSAAQQTNTGTLPTI